MEQRKLGSTGLTVSALGFGCGSIGGLMVRGEPAEQTRAVARALEAGITYFDTAPGYGNGRSEENLGRALRELNAWNRVVVGTKVRLSPTDRLDPAGAIRRSLERSLRLLGRTSIDLLQLHNSISRTGNDASGALAQQHVLTKVVRALEQVRRDGLIRHAGFTGLGETDALHAVVRSGSFATVQSYFNALNPSAGYIIPPANTESVAPVEEAAPPATPNQDFAGLIDAAEATGMGVIAIRVMAAGAVSAQPERPLIAGDPARPLVGGASYAADLERAQRLVDLANDLGLDGPVELALRFALSKHGISTALTGFSDSEQLEQAIRWSERGPLPPDAVQRTLDLGG